MRQDFSLSEQNKGEWFMFSVGRDDVLRALKKFRRLAKQDLLASVHTADPEFWRDQAEARRSAYGTLMNSVNKSGVETAYQEALQAYAALPLLHADDKDPLTSGVEQAHEMFLVLLGIDSKKMIRIRRSRRPTNFTASQHRLAVRAGR